MASVRHPKRHLVLHKEINICASQIRKIFKSWLSSQICGRRKKLCHVFQLKIKEEDNMENPAIGALRAFLDVDWRLYPNNGKQMEVILMNNTVSVKNSSASSSEKVKFLYDLQGRSLNCKPENGIYIEKKMFFCEKHCLPPHINLSPIQSNDHLSPIFP